MLTKNEITSLNLSPTKKDFVQIWNELLEVAGKLSERWDPTSTNESDPGIVILKALTGIADKLNYNIDKNTLEAFMPTAAQEDSMRKLCEMLGYSMKYYQSATTTVNIKYHNSAPEDAEKDQMEKDGLIIPKFTVITNNDLDISYFTTDIDRDSYIISKNKPVVTDIPCMEGQIVKCESLSDNNVITISQISENNRFYLPEIQIAENGVFIYNAYVENSMMLDGEKWLKVDNLNTQARGTRVFKFGFDSYASRPYIEFPEDYSELFGEGVFIYYARTNGVNGNISARVLTQLELPSGSGWNNVSAASFSVENVFAATNGANTETISQAYSNFKKTIGTFETLVTCRDYMNKIYSMINERTGKPRVSNILVTDIRNDLNRSVPICSCDGAGIFYKEMALSSANPISTLTKPIYSTSDQKWHLGNDTGLIITDFVEDSTFNAEEAGEAFVTNDNSKHWTIKQEDKIFETNLPVGPMEPAISHFDIVFYPFKSYNQIKNNTKTNVKDIRAVYDSSFDLLPKSSIESISNELDADGIKTIAHNPKLPQKDDIVSINNYLRLSATIATNAKVTEIERDTIIDNIKIALANAFNMRELDFGDEIPFDRIVEVIENADARIRVASLNEPALYTTFSVLEDYSNDIPVITEYAVASDWLDVDTAISTGRFDINDITRDATGKIISFSSGTFNSTTAKKIYNELAVRNVLAGRVPLFNYNNTFKTSFSEGAYHVTRVLESGHPNNQLPVPSADDPFTIWTEDDVVYTAVCKEYEGNIDDGTTSITYMATGTPEDYKNVVKDGVIAEGTGDATISGSSNIPQGNTGVGQEAGSTITDYITDIRTDCKILSDDSGLITDVTLADGEYIKFRAPNLTTVKTYPAYVNYHLHLSDKQTSEAQAAVAHSLFETLNSDVNSWSDNPNIKWQKMLDYFDSIEDKTYKKTFTIAQTVSFNSADAGNTADDLVDDLKTTISVGVNNVPFENTEYTIESLLAMSGCVKLTNTDFTARVDWTPQDGEEEPPKGLELPTLVLDEKDFKNPFISSINVLIDIKNAIDNALALYKTKLFDTDAEGYNPDLAKVIGHTFTVYLDFECVPFEARSLQAWETFIKTCANKFGTDYPYQIFDYKPQMDTDTGTILWRMFGDGYNVGKYVTEDTEKLLKFTSSYFGLLPTPYLTGIYTAETLGKDRVPTVIKNNEEYALGEDEKLYIEYTPSSATEDGTVKAAVTEIYGEGTIIRPNGFKAGLIDSAEYEKNGNTKTKSVIFAQVSNVPINMYSLGAQEQIEIRELAEVSISKTSFNDAAAVYIYKNFNNCPALEIRDTDEYGNRINNSYTLKDGEYIFYTDKDKSEFAYYTSGTEVTLSGKLVLPKFDVIELSTIFDSGIQEIPWEYKSLGSEIVIDKGAQKEIPDAITFQEYQYITLGPGDTLLKSAMLGSASTAGKLDKALYLDENWRFCSDVEYTVAGDPDNTITLPIINIPGRAGGGWEASSTLELNVSANSGQTLRSTDKVKSSITLFRTSATGGGLLGGTIIEPQVSGVVSSTNQVMSFKTNLACRACGNSININDVLYNPNNLKGFQLKVYTADAPVLVKTAPGKVVPHSDSGITDINLWTGKPLTKDYAELWNSVGLDEIRVGETSDNALRLPINLSPNTYGVFCIYADYTKSDSTAWIEVIPGTKMGDITLLNVEEDDAKIEHLTMIENGVAVIDNTRLSKIYLKPGVNCIQANKPCKIFIKASKESEGTLYFDELRLVNSREIKYINSSGEPLSMYTLGLNLEQLGYLDAVRTDSTKLDGATRTKLKTALVNEAYAQIEKSLADDRNDFSTNYLELKKLLPEIENLVEYESGIKEDLIALQKLKTDNPDNFDALCDKYNSVKDALDVEIALQDALNNNTKANELEKQLVALLSTLSSSDDPVQQIIDQLSELKDTATTALKNTTNEDVLADFIKYIKNDSSAEFNEVKAAAANAIELDYQEQLTTLVNKLVQVINSEEKNTLLATLAELREKEQSSTRTNLLTLVNKLSATIDKTSITSTLSDMLDAAGSAASENLPDYPRLYSLAVGLNDLIETRGLKAIVAEIELAANVSDDIKLKTLVNELNTLIPLTNSSTATTDDFCSLLSSIISDVYENIKTGKTEFDAALLTNVLNLNTKFADDFSAKLDAIVGSIEDCIDELEASTNISTLIDLLTDMEKANDDNDNSQVRPIVESIKQLIEDRGRYKNALNSVTTTNMSSTYVPAEEREITEKAYNHVRELIRAAILTVWPAHMSIRLAGLLSNIDRLFIKEIVGELLQDLDSDLEELFEKYEQILDNFLGQQTEIMQNVLSSNAIQKLFDKTKLLLGAYKQKKQDIASISNISGLVPDSNALVNALSSLSESYNNAAIKTLIAAWQGTDDVVQKQNLQVTLKDKLAKAINTDKQLFNVVANILWPNIARYNIFKAELPEDDTFYTELSKAVTGLENGILANTLDYNNVDIIVDTKYVDLLSGSQIDFENSLKEKDFEVYEEDGVSLLPSLLPRSTVLDIIGSLKNDLASISNKKSEFGTLTNKNLVSMSATDIEDLYEAGEVSDSDIKAILEDLCTELKDIESRDSVKEGFEDASNILTLEEQLLADIRAMDTDRTFYYNVPVEDHLAIELNESDKKLNTLMNPLVNYDINNVNNSFVISKLDIGYLDNGIKVARSSRLN